MKKRIFKVACILWVTIIFMGLSMLKTRAAEYRLNSFEISGQVTGDIQNGVTINLSEYNLCLGGYRFKSSTSTDYDGYYSFSKLTNNAYKVEPVKEGYEFSPASFEVKFPLTELADYDFIAEQQRNNNCDCPPTFYCNHPTGECNDPGVCVKRPEICLAIYNPVCGCDGKTYSNGCYAANNGVSVNYNGECKFFCVSNRDCPTTDYYCIPLIFKCGYSGVCVKRPEICPTIYNPVCGCDGKTYSNECYAANNRVSVSYNGECTSVEK